MNEVAVATSFALALAVLAALSFSEVGDRTVLYSNLVVIIILSILVSEAAFRLVLGGKLDVDVSNHVFSDVVNHHDVSDLSIPAEFVEYLLVELFEVLSCLEQFILANLKSICEGDCCHGVGVQ